MPITVTATAESADQGAATSLFSNGDLERGERAYKESALLEVGSPKSYFVVLHSMNSLCLNETSSNLISTPSPPAPLAIGYAPQRLKSAVESAHPDAPPEAVVHVAHEGNR